MIGSGTTGMTTRSADVATRKAEFQFLGLTRARTVAFVLFALFIAIAPMFIYDIFLMRVFCLIIFACAWNLLLGYTGLMSFGHAAFFGTGAYLCGLAATLWGLPTELAIIAGTLSAAALGLVFGWVAIRRQGLYFAMITLALAQMAYFVAVQAPFTGGEDGIQAVPRGSLLGIVNLNSNTALYWTMVVMVLGSILFYNRIVHSPFGQVLRAIRNNPERAKSLGYDVDRFKLASFTISAGLAGFAASWKTVIFGIATLDNISLLATTEVVLVTLVGGIGTIFGPVVGAFLILSLEHYLSGYGPWVLLIEGIVFILCVLLFRQGIVGSLQAWIKKPL
jgi:branched-chain amino acid transport system permease protein